jgi:carbamoyl-phosphate synthase / aspartate carbamoyltransferase / dihydroorotase
MYFENYEKRESTAIPNTVFFSQKIHIFLKGSYKDKNNLLDSIRILEELGFNLYASRGTADYYSEHQIKVETVDWRYEDSGMTTSNNNALNGTPTLTSTTDSSSSSSSMTHQNQRTVADYLTSKHFDLVINIPMKSSATFRASSFMTQGYQTRGALPLTTRCH